MSKNVPAAPPPVEFFKLVGVHEASREIDGLVIAFQHSLARNVEIALRDADAVKAARVFVAMRHLKDQIETLVKSFNAVFEPLKEETLPVLLEERGVKFVPLAEGYRVGTSVKFMAGIQAGKKAEALAWLEANGLGDLIQPTVNAQTLSAAFKHRVEEQNLDVPEELFHNHLQPSTSVTTIPKAKSHT